jgi:hypothetical protein
MTGRGAGYCAGYHAPGFMNPSGGRMGLGFRWGHGRGWRWQTYASPVPYGVVPYGVQPYGPSHSPKQELDFLQNQAKTLSDHLTEIEKRISELEAETKRKTK